MSRRLAFWLSRTADLRVMAPVIDAAASRPGLEVVVLIPGWTIGRAYYTVDADGLRASLGSRVRIRVLETPGRLEGAILDEAAETVVTVLPRITDVPDDVGDGARQRTRMRGVTWAALPYAYHQDYLCATEPERLARDWDLVATLGPYSLDVVDHELRRADPVLRRKLRARLAAIGYPELDVIPFLDRAAILSRYELPADRPIIVFSTANTFRAHGAADHRAAALEARFRGWRPWSRRALRALPFAFTRGPILPYRRYLATIRALAGANGAYVVAKSRVKHDDPPYVGDYVDRVVEDVSFFPATSLELLSVASLNVNFISTTALEAIACGCPTLAVWQLPLERMIEPVSARFGRRYCFDPGSFANSPGASELIDGTSAAGASRLSALATASLADLRGDATAREAALDRFLAVRGKSSAAFLDAVAALA